MRHSTMHKNISLLLISDMQTLLDSVQGRAKIMAFLHSSTTELESCIITWDFMETIHSRSYTYHQEHILKLSIFDVFDTILDEDAIIKKGSLWSQKNILHFIELGRRRLLGLKVDEYELYKALCHWCQ